MSASDDQLAEIRRLAQQMWMSADRQGSELIRAFRALDQYLSAGGDVPAAWAGEVSDALPEPDVVLTKTEADMVSRLLLTHKQVGTLPVELEELFGRIPLTSRDPGRPIAHAMACPPVTDSGSNVVWFPFADPDGFAVGWRAVDKTTGRGEFIYLVPSDTSELAEGEARVANVFVYQGDAGDPVHDESLHYYEARLG